MLDKGAFTAVDLPRPPFRPHPEEPARINSAFTRVFDALCVRASRRMGAAPHVRAQDNARSAGVYAARIVGRTGDLYVRIGGDDGAWQPLHSGYRDYRQYADGAGWKVWLGLPGNPGFQEAPLKGALPIPVYREPYTIEVPDGVLN